MEGRTIEPSRIAALWAVVLGALMVASCHFDEPPLIVPEPEPAAQEAWITLFDGTSSNSLRGYRQQSFPSNGWVIDQGTLKTLPEGEHVDLITREQFENFELQLEWKVSSGGNGGIFFHVSEDGEQMWHSAFELQVLDDDGHTDGKTPSTSAGSLYALIAPQGKSLKPVGEFNQARLVVRGAQVEHWLNGVRVLQIQMDDPALRGRIAESKFAPYPQFARGRSGHIGLQHHGQEIWFRDIKIRRLNP